MNLYNYLGLYRLMLIQTYIIRDSHRRYRSSPYSELILIHNFYLIDLCLFRTPVGVTELILIQNFYLTDLCLFRTPVGVTELIHIRKYL